MDDKLLEALAADGVGTFSMASGLTTGDFGWGSQTFHKMVGIAACVPATMRVQDVLHTCCRCTCGCEHSGP